MNRNVSPKNRPVKGKVPTFTGISIGAGCILVPIESLYEQFAPFGVTMYGFRKFLKAMTIPMTRMPGGVDLVDLLTFQLAFRALNRLGSPDYYFPGHYLIKNNEKPRHAQPKVDLSPAAWKAALSELLYLRTLTGHPPSRGVKTDFEGCLARLAQATASQMTQIHSETLLSVESMADPVTSPQEVDDDAV